VRAFNNALTRNTSSSNDSVQFDKNSPVGKLQELSKKLDQSNQKMEAAQKAGDTNAQASAAFEALGTLFGGGRRVNPLNVDELKPFVPETLAGLPKTSSTVGQNGIGGIMAAQAEATYSSGGKEIQLEITDSGGVSGLLAFASWTGVQEDKEDDSGFERTHK